MGGQTGIKKSHIWRQRQPIIVNEIWDQGNVKLCNRVCSKHFLLVGAQNTFSKKGSMIQRSQTKPSESGFDVTLVKSQRFKASNEDEHTFLEVSL